MSLDSAMHRARARRQTPAFSTPDLRPTSKATPSKTLSVFTRQWAALMSAGVPLVQAFELLSQSTVGSKSTRKAFSHILNSLRSDVSAGNALHLAFRKHPNTFKPLYCSLLQAGESAGILDKLLDRLADTLEANETLRAKVKNALIYPASILTIAAGVVWVIMVWVVPVFEDVFKSMGATLPWATQCLVSASAFIAQWGFVIFMTAACCLYACIQAYRNSLKFQISLEKWVLITPVIGPLKQAALASRWGHTLSALLQAGIPLSEALMPAASAADSPSLKMATLDLVQQIQEGHGFSQAMSKSSLFPPLVIQMCAIGEETGSLDALLLRAAQLMESDLNQKIGNFSTLLEPAIMVLLGTVVGGILVALYLPIFNLGQVF